MKQPNQIFPCRVALLLGCSLLMVSSAGVLQGCSTTRTPLASTTGTTLVRSGTVVEVRDVEVRGGNTNGLASAVGALLGGIAGSSIGSGSGSVVAATGGALAGGIAGQHAAESASQKKVQVKVRLENGEEHIYLAEPGQSFQVGDVVRLTTDNAGTRLRH